MVKSLGYISRMHIVSRARLATTSFALAAVTALSIGAAAPAMADEDLQPLPPVREVGGSSLGSVTTALGSSSPCDKLDKQLAEVKLAWDTAVTDEDYDKANLLRIDYTNIAVSMYQCNLARGSWG